MVATGQPLATEAGVRMLEMGGNAAAAAVAAAIAIAIVESTMNSIGGRNQILVGLNDGQRTMSALCRPAIDQTLHERAEVGNN